MFPLKVHPGGATCLCVSKEKWVPPAAKQHVEPTPSGP